MDLTAEYVRSRLDYVPETGRFFWKADEARPQWSGRYAGKMAGRVNSRGYISFSLTREGKEFYCLAHRVAWLLTFGEWPTAHLDHINRDRIDNRIANLRQATPAQNAWNCGEKPNKSGYRGVTQTPCGNFIARCRALGQTHNLGTYRTAEQAKAARDDFASRAHGEFAAHFAGRDG